MVTLGKISGVFGIKGWVKVFSHTARREGILDYNPWFLRVAGEWRPWQIEQGNVQGKGVIVAQLEGLNERSQAESLVGCEIAVPREQLETLRPGEYYWVDLVGLEVVTIDGKVLGTVDHLFETGANDVMVVRGDRERLVPWIQEQVVKSVDLQGKRMVVDWDPDF